MTHKSASELEHEAEVTRSKMTETAESLQRKMSPGQILDELGSYFKNSDGSMALENLKTQVRDNPLPLALIGTGLAWLFMGGGPRAEQLARQARGAMEYGSEAGGAAPGESWQGEPGMRDLAKGMTSGGGDMDSDKAGGAMGMASDAVRSAAEGAQWASRKTGEAGQYASSHARDAGSRVQKVFNDTLEQEPLIIGALGVAVGAAIGAMLPRTKLEDEYVAPYGDRMREGLKDAVKHGLEDTKDVASQAFRAGKGEAERQNLSAEGASALDEKAGKVVKRAGAAAEETTRAKLDNANDKGTQ